MKFNLREHIVKKRKIEKTDVIIFLIVFLIFTFALLSFFPGLLTSDCADQIRQAKTNMYKSSHPIIHSFIIGNLAKLGGIWVPALFQIVIISIIWTYEMKILRKYNDSNKNKIFQVILTLIVCIIPLNFLYSITLWKDILYSYSLLLSLIFIYIGVKENFKFTFGQIILIALSNIGVMRFRHNGMPIGLLMFCSIVIISYIKNKNKKDFIKFIVSFITIYCIFTIPTKLVNDITPKTEGNAFTSTRVYCIGAMMYEGVQFEESELEFLNKILDTETWKNNYSPYTGTDILFHPDYNKSKILDTKEGNDRLTEIFNKYAMKNVGIIINHFLSVNSIWWSPNEKGGMHAVILDNNWISNEWPEYNTRPVFNWGNDLLTKLYSKSVNQTYKYNILYRPAVATIISIILCTIICVKNKKIGYALIIIPMLLNIATYILLISSQDHRYFYPCHVTEYLLIAICGCEFIKSKKIIKKKKELIKNNPKTLVIIPAYNEEKSIKKVVDSVYSQKIHDLDVVVINDGSSDNTYEVAEQTKAIVIDSPNNLGIGGTVQTGYLYALQNNYDIAIQIDGDGQHDPKYIKQLIEEVKKGNDLVIGSRFTKNGKYEQTFARMLGINIISALIKSATNVKIYDTTSGYRAANRRIIKEFAKQYPYDYPEPGSTLNVIKAGYIVKEIPVEMRKREAGTSFVTPIKSISYMAKVILSIIIRGIIE